MAIRLEFLNLIIPIGVIDQHYPGGFKALVAQIQAMIGRKLWYDEHLYRDGAMDPRDMERLVDFWTAKGLTPFEERGGKQYWKEMCVVDFLGGPTLPCAWLEHDRTDSSVYLKGKPKGTVIGREERKPVNQKNCADSANRGSLP